MKATEGFIGRAETRPSVEMTIYLVAGEASGDNHGASLMQALRRLRPALRLLGRGGPKMKAIAGERFIDWSDEAGVVGLWEVVKHYPYFREEFRKTVNEIAATRPDAIVLIDYPGFNLRLARTLHEARTLSGLGGKIIYYISPQVWAWNRGRIPQMARWLDLMLCIFPFEAELYEQSGLRTIFVGHPMIDDLETKRIEALRAPHLVGLFPGSRAREVRKLLPILIGVMEILHKAAAGFALRDFRCFRCPRRGDSARTATSCQFVRPGRGRGRGGGANDAAKRGWNRGFGYSDFGVGLLSNALRSCLQSGRADLSCRQDVDSGKTSRYA